jgi:hypothetical protein
MTLTVQQCAQQIKVVPHSIRRWIWAGKLPAKKIPQGREQWTYLVNAEDWQRFVEEREKRPLPDAQPIPVSPLRPSHSHIYFESSDPDDRLIQQAVLMKQALNGCRASREALRAEPFRLIYWMAVDGVK